MKIPMIIKSKQAFELPASITHPSLLPAPIHTSYSAHPRLLNHRQAPREASQLFRARTPVKILIARTEYSWRCLPGAQNKIILIPSKDGDSLAREGCSFSLCGWWSSCARAILACLQRSPGFRRWDFHFFPLLLNVQCNVWIMGTGIQWRFI